MKLNLTFAAILALSPFATLANSDSMQDKKIKSVVDEKSTELMEKYDIPGLAVAVTVDGERYFYNYGFADKGSSTPVTNETIFELGSISKTFAAALAGYAQEKGALNMNDKISDHIEELKDTPLGNSKLVHIATYTAGGLPLQFPNEVTNHDEMMQYYKSWKAEFEVGTKRKYSNPSIGLFGYIGSQSMQSDYTEMMEKIILPELGMTNTFVDVPDDKVTKYAYGYNAKGESVRVNPGVLDAEAYGIKSTSTDMIQFIEANMGIVPIDVSIKHALENSHIGYFDTKTFTQAVGWEGYNYPTSLSKLLEGNSSDVILNAKSVTPSITGNLGSDVWFNKTGSTGGFGAYVAYVPSEKVGVVILANKKYPNTERVESAYDIINSIVN
ncbi:MULTISPECIES: class C beta-lactamase [Vibrio]|uniref:class C beta-lactamase n=1 Tax=Vibrio TaxID=662 RepID=UPI000B5C8000|nr:MULTISPECIES: class C beta-lactamase [Vibrio]HBV75257.1 class C beta-lactamase [Vibrio sp.]